MSFRIRRNTLIAQRIEVALVYREMLGAEEAIAYLARENISESITKRILGDGQMRDVANAGQAAPASERVTFTQCRRRNHLHDAIVEAALKIEAKLGRDWALALLRDENVPDAVAERILAQGPRRLRIKQRPR